MYDTYTLSLINHLIMCGFPDLHMRMDERCFLNSLRFDKILDRLEDRIRTTKNYNNSLPINDAVINQIETYKKLYETDKRNANNKRLGHGRPRFRYR